MQCTPNNYDGCLSIIAHQGTFTGKPWVWGLLVWFGLSLIFGLAVYFIERPLIEKRVHDPRKRRAEWIETAAMYFGVVMNLSLFLYVFIIQYFARHQYHKVYFMDPNPYWFSPWGFALVFLVSNVIMFGLIIWGQKERHKSMDGISLGLGFGFIVLASLLLMGALFIMKPEVTLDPKEQHYLQDAYQTFQQYETRLKHENQLRLAEAKEQQVESEKILRELNQTSNLPIPERIRQLQRLEKENPSIPPLSSISRNQSSRSRSNQSSRGTEPFPLSSAAMSRGKSQSRGQNNISLEPLEKANII